MLPVLSDQNPVSGLAGPARPMVPLEARSRSAKTSSGTKFKSRNASFSLSADALPEPPQGTMLRQGAAEPRQAADKLILTYIDYIDFIRKGIDSLKIAVL